MKIRQNRLGLSATGAGLAVPHSPQESPFSQERHATHVLGRAGKVMEPSKMVLSKENSWQSQVHTLSGQQTGLCMGKTEVGTGAKGGKRFGGMPFGSHFSGML